MTDFERVLRYYLHGHYTAEQLEIFVRAGVISEEEKERILALKG